jgi:RimJ/RimL family protein N-acetyltransferase
MSTKTINPLNIEKINNLKLSTQRLDLTKFSSKDVVHNVEHEMNPEIMRYIKDPQTREKIKKETIKFAKDYSGKESDWVLFATWIKETDNYVGMVCFRYESIENNTVEMGWRLGLEYHGKGYATEAAKAVLEFIKSEIKPHKVMAYCVAENTGSSNIMKKLGMQQEGCLREYGQLGGKWFDEAIYGLIIYTANFNN